MIKNYFDESGKSLQELLDDLVLIYYYDIVENKG